MFKWNSFPKDIKAKILSYLPGADLESFEKTSKFNKFLSDEYFLWKKLYNDLYDKEEIFHKAVACYVFLDNLQNRLNYINDDHIKCGCDRCTDFYGGSYPGDEENYIDNNENGYPSMHSSNGQMTKKDNVCLLYEWFKTLCSKFNCPIPDDNVDHPFVHPRSWNITTCLGKGLCDDDHMCGSLIDNHHHWRYYIKNMTFKQQKNTVYRMIHAMSDRHNYFANSELDSSFESWFSVKGNPL